MRLTVTALPFTDPEAAGSGLIHIVPDAVIPIVSAVIPAFSCCSWTTHWPLPYTSTFSQSLVDCLHLPGLSTALITCSSRFLSRFPSCFWTQPLPFCSGQLCCCLPALIACILQPHSLHLFTLLLVLACKGSITRFPTCITENIDLIPE